MSLYLGNTPIANTGYDKANTDLSNLTSTGKNIANWSNNVTNCITEIPQDIKLELNNGTLTLKAGSKIYNGNGLITTTDVDILDPTASVNDTVFLIYVPSTNSLGTAYMTGESVSSLPTPTTSYKLYYNTTDRKCYIDNGIWLETSFPLAITTSTTTQFVSIDQIFNGFGYIGSTVFALPGVKGLIPNGRNADGTLKNIESTLTKVHTYWLDPAWGTGLNGYKFYLRVFDEVQGGFAGDVQPDTRVIYSKGIPSSTYTGVYYDTEENKWFWVNNGEISAQDKMFLGASFIANITATTFTVAGEWNPRKPFHALDYNDSSTISGWSMPSSRSIALTLGASGATYTAPANGYFNFRGMATAAGQFVYIGDANYNNVAFQRSTVGNGDWVVYSIPVAKGNSIIINYSTETNNTLYFVYTEGESNV